MEIVTDRLIIKETTINDVELLLKMDKQEETQRFLGGVKNKTKEERIAFLDKKEKKLKDGIAYPFTVFLKDDTRVGFIDLKKVDDIYELSYIFDFDYCNNGYCTEACKIVLDTLNINKVFAYSLKDNNNSRRVLEKLGFKYINTVNRDNSEFLYYEREV